MGRRISWSGWRCIALAQCEGKPLGWLLFLLSNGAWIVYGIKVGAHGLVVMQIGFTLTSLMGVYRWLVAAKM